MIIMFQKKTLLIVASGILIMLVGLLFLFNHHPAQPTLSWQLANKTFVIDPGHGGIFPGKVSADGIAEKEINMAIAQQVADLLQESGAKVVLTRTTDTDLIPASESQSKLLLKQRADLKQRTILAAEQQADLFISIHCNSIPSNKWCGAQTFFAPNNADSQHLALNIQSSIIKQLKNTQRQAIARPDTFLFENLAMPAVIIECGFLSNAEETQRLIDPAYQQKIAYAIYSGIGDYLNATESPVK